MSGDELNNSNIKSQLQKKILIMGLHKSGKTSIILCLQGNPNLMSFYNIKPTLGINIQNFRGNNDQELVVWEMGGQDKYREKYIENFDRYLDGTYKIIFIIDVQDKENYNKSLDYLKNIINEFEKVKKFPEFSIFLHKFDPNLELLNEYSNEVILKQLIEPIRNIIPKNVKFDIFKTTIYTVFKKKLI